jgi:hypothetical protein
MAYLFNRGREYAHDDDYLYNIKTVVANEKTGAVWYSVSARRRTGGDISGWAFRETLTEACQAARDRITENEYWAAA